MTEERLHFNGETNAPNAMYAAEHLSRYAVLAPFVAGKRVLDIACGEGYGSWFLKEWGAAEVVGVDISEDAITAAQKNFGRDGVRYLVGDACKAQEFLDHASFDIIVSFETVEHVADPLGFLEGLRTLAAINAGFFISCPNDYVSMSLDKSNPFHLRKYTFEEFQDLSEGVLGKGDQWLLGTNVQGYAFIADGDLLISRPMQNWQSIVNAKAGGNVQILPSQSNVCPDRKNVLCYLGVWGGKDPVSAVTVSAQSYSAFIEPWQTIDWLNEQLANLQETKAQENREILKLQDDCRKSPSQAEISVSQARHRTMGLASQVAALQKERHSLGLRVAEYEDQVMCKDQSIMDLESLVVSRDSQLEASQRERHSLERRITEYKDQSTYKDQSITSLELLLAYRDSQLLAIYNSKSWKFTKILRTLGRLARGEFSSVFDSLRHIIKK